MLAFQFCIPTVGKAVHVCADWFHGIKYDGYRLRVERDGNRVRLLTRNGFGWTERYPWIAEAALKNRAKQFVIDGDAVILGADGVAGFNALHSREHQAFPPEKGALNTLDCRRRGAANESPARSVRTGPLGCMRRRGSTRIDGAPIL